MKIALIIFLAVIVLASIAIAVFVFGKAISIIADVEKRQDVMRNRKW